MVNISKSDLETVVFYGFRYALGRRTYAVEDMCHIIRKYVDELTPQTKIKICEEIKEAIINNQAGMTQDIKDWSRLAEDIEKTLALDIKV